MTAAIFRSSSQHPYGHTFALEPHRVRKKKWSNTTLTSSMRVLPKKRHGRKKGWWLEDPKMSAGFLWEYNFFTYFWCFFSLCYCLCFEKFSLTTPSEILHGKRFNNYFIQSSCCHIHHNNWSAFVFLLAMIGTKLEPYPAYTNLLPLNSLFCMLSYVFTNTLAKWWSEIEGEEKQC